MHYLRSEVEQVETCQCATISHGVCVFGIITMLQSEMWENIKFFCKPGKSGRNSCKSQCSLMNKALKNPLYRTV
jgi:hypothetical protein